MSTEYEKVMQAYKKEHFRKNRPKNNGPIRGDIPSRSTEVTAYPSPKACTPFITLKEKFLSFIEKCLEFRHSLRSKQIITILLV